MNIRFHLRHDHPFLQAGAAAAQLAKEQCGDFAKGCFRWKRKFRATLSNQSRPAKQPLDQLHGDRRGSGGKPTLAFPRRLCAAFDARKRPPTTGQTQLEETNIPQELKKILSKDFILSYKNGKYISLINSKEIHRMTDCIGNISENYYISKFNINDCKNLIYAITNKDGEILCPTLADYIFFTENKEFQMCILFAVVFAVTSMILSILRISHQSK